VTAEIIIMNKSAVALAADSAVTVSGPSASKVYNSANKLFMLTRDDPVGVMIYGSAQYLGMPWETIIKDFRDSPEAQTYDHLEDYADAFIRYLSSADHLCDAASAREWALAFVRGYFSSVVKKTIDDAVAERIASRGSITEAQTKALAGRVIRDGLREIETKPLLFGVDEAAALGLARQLSAEVEAGAAAVFQQLPLSARARTSLKKTAASLLLREGPWPDQAATGLVIAGFGKCDFYPRSFHFMPRGRIDGTLYYAAPVVQAVDDAQSAVVQAFAQHEMVRTFLEGIDPRFKDAVNAWVRKILNGLVGVAPQLGPVAPSLLSDFEQAVEELSATQFRNDIIGTVAILPKDELAAMAESLVNLTSFKRRVTMAQESVGGPIDVAVVSKGDGFVWIKRKHYFEPDLNPHFFKRYR
jgi:hypothetical protein